MELQPILEIELLKTPQIALKKNLTISSVIVGEKIIDFRNSAGTFVESLNIKDGKVNFEIEHYYPGSSGGSIYISCSVNVKNNTLSQPLCHEKE